MRRSSVSNTRKYTLAAGESVKVLVPDIVTILWVAGSGATGKMQVTLEESPIGAMSVSPTPELTFADTGGDDTLTRENGSWIADGFDAGHELTVGGSVSNNGTFLIKSVDEKVITFDTGVTLTDETVAAGDASIAVSSELPIAQFHEIATLTGPNQAMVTYEFGPNAIRFSTAGGALTVWVKG